MQLKKYKGSITVEASFVLPIFFFALLFFIYFFLILSMQTIIGESLFETGRFISRCEKINRVDNVTLYSEFQKNIIFNCFNFACIKGGRLGIRLGCERLGESEEEIKLSVSYNIQIPILIFRIREIPMKQTLKTRIFVGQGMKNGFDDNKLLEKDSNDNIVFITENGNVYHKSKECSHLRLSIKPILYNKVEQARNIGGGRYKCCERCGKEKITSDIVFITLDGNRYHSSLQCSGLKRTIIEISLNEVRNWTCCKRCG